MGRTVVFGAVTITLALLVAACGSAVDPVAVTASSPAPATSVESASGSAMVAELTVAPETTMDGYERELFKLWTDADGDSCDTRCEVLERQERSDLPGLGGGGWESIYEGYTTNDPSELDVDHMVALGEAWRSGAASWSADRREAFANDLEPGALVAVTASTNRSKGDRDPAAWQPPSRDAWCWYGRSWVDTKLRWGLSADQAEVTALTNMLNGC